MRRAPLVALAGLLACPPPAYEATSSPPWETGPKDSSGTDASGGATATSSSTGEPTGGPDPATSSSGDAEMPALTSTSTTGFEPEPQPTTDEPNYPPEILSLEVMPGKIEQAGTIELVIAATEDAVEAEIEFDGKTETVKLDWPTTTYPAEVTSQKQCQEAKFVVTVSDGWLTDKDELTLTCEMPESGTELYTTPLAGLNGSSAADVALLPDGGALVAGTKDGRMTLWALDAVGAVKFGWPKTIDKWSLDPKFDSLPSYATTVALDAEGRIFVGGAVKEATGLRRYVAKFNAQGFLMWEDPGVVVGEEIAGMAVTTDGVAVATGSIRTSAANEEPAFDLGVWGYPPGFPQVQSWSDSFKAPATDPDPDLSNELSERGYDVGSLADGEVIIVGEREYRDEQLNLYQRATALRYASDGTRLGTPWTSEGDKFAHDAARSVVRTAEGYAAVGWGEHDKNPVRQVLVHRFDLAGNHLAVQPEVSAMYAQGEGISQDREKKLVIAATTLEANVWGAWIFPTTGADQPHLWEQIEAKTVAAAIECDAWGACTWVGTAELNGKSTAIASKRAP